MNRGTQLGDLSNAVAFVRRNPLPRKQRMFSVGGEVRGFSVPKRRCLSTSGSTAEPPEKLNSEYDDPLLPSLRFMDVPKIKAKIQTNGEQKKENIYDQEIFDYLCQREKLYMVDSKVLTQDNPKLDRCRKKLVDWILIVAYKLEMSQETLYLTINLIDRVLEMNAEYYKRIQILGLGALYLCSKMEEYYPADLNVLEKICNKHFTRMDMIHMEKELLQITDFKLQSVEPITYMNRLIRVTKYSEAPEFKEITILLFDSILFSPHYSSIRSSLVAASAVCAALSLYEEPWSVDLVSTSQFLGTQVVTVACKMLCSVYQMKGDGGPYTTLAGIRKKYSSSSEHMDIYNSPRLEKNHILHSMNWLSKCM